MALKAYSCEMELCQNFPLVLHINISLHFFIVLSISSTLLLTLMEAIFHRSLGSVIGHALKSHSERDGAIDSINMEIRCMEAF